MQRTEARDLLLVAAKSLRSDPPSFSFTVNMTGMKVSNTGGIGVLAAPSGGGPGSTTIGVQASGNTGDIEVTLAAVDDNLHAQVAEAADVIGMIAAELEKDDAKPGVMDALLKRIPSQVVGAGITAMVAAIIAAVNT